MHELAITQQLLQLTLERATAAGAKRVTSVNLAIGELSTFSEDAVGFCWEHVATQTPCEGAALHFRRVPGELTCRDCHATHAWNGELVPCTQCGSLRLEITAGDDLILESLEAEVEPEPSV
jgi:hydrogenase nickel incorporation protein HypA/HybF